VETFVQGYQLLMSEPFSIIGMILGVIMGIIFGCIPGLTATLGVLLMIPMTYAMSPVMGFAILIGIYVGGISGGLIAATLLNIPGTPSSIFTCWDAYPMAQNGRPATALSIGISASVFGGLFSAVALMFIAPQLTKVALTFGYWELFGLILLAMSTVAVVIEGDTLRCFAAICIGLLIGCVGLDSFTAQERLTFGAWQLSGGFQSTAIMMGLFATCEIMQQLKSLNRISTVVETQRVSLIPPFKEMKGTLRTLLFGSVTGVLIGILPAVGQQTAALVTYNQAKGLSKHPEEFGKGCVEGIVASESANNAVCGGAIIPLITLGIPGDMTTAALIGGLMIHGLQPGPMLYKENIGLVGAIMLVYLFSNIAMYLIEAGFIKQFVRLLSIPKYILFPAIFICCVMGTFALNNRVFDVWVLFGASLVGYAMTQLRMPILPLIIGGLMGQTFERNLRRALIASKGNFMDIFNRPLAAIFFIMSVLIIISPIVIKRIKALRKRKAVRASVS
jgi:putative tricarboxylic transport membrane protein